MSLLRFRVLLVVLSLLLFGQAAAEFGYDPERGTYIRTTDGRWEFNPYAMVQILNLTSMADSAPASTSFAVHAAKLIFHGHIASEKLTYHFQVNFGDGKAVAENMYLHYQLFSRLGLLVGQIEVPFNRQHITLEAYQQFIERSQVDRRFTLQRNVGLAVYVSTVNHTVEWTSGIWRAPGADSAAATLAPVLTSRVAVNPMGPIDFREGDLARSPKPRFSMALAGAFDPHAAASVTTASAVGTTTSTVASAVWQGVTEATFRYRDISLTSEAHLRRRDGAQPGLDYGVFVQLGVLVPKSQLELVGRYAYLGGDLGPADITRETTAGLSYYFRGHRLKLQGNYSNTATQAGAMLHRVLFQLEFFV